MNFASRLVFLWLLVGLTRALVAAERITLVWPTPQTAWVEGKPLVSILQHAGSGDPESGGFGGVRSGGSQFHEGIDIRPVARDRRGEPTDDVFAALPGVVRHISAAAGDSSYGRYIVIEHPEVTPAVYTLYAHLARIAPGVKVGSRVDAGRVIGTMGHSSGGYMIPKDRSHLHFEIGLAVSRDYQGWHDRQRLGGRNEHGMWNGQNLMGMDPLAFFADWRAGRIHSVQEAFERMTPVVRLRIATSRVPDFITRYPSLLRRPMPEGPVAGWEIVFNWTGIPFAWTPLNPMEVAGLVALQPRILEVNAEVERRERSRTLAVSRRGNWVPAKDLQTVLDQMFGPGVKP